MVHKYSYTCKELCINTVTSCQTSERAAMRLDRQALLKSFDELLAEAAARLDLRELTARAAREKWCINTVTLARNGA